METELDLMLQLDSPLDLLMERQLEYLMVKL